MQFLKNNGKYEKTRDIKLVTTERRRIYLVSELNDHTTKCFTENLPTIKMKKKKEKKKKKNR